MAEKKNNGMVTVYLPVTVTTAKGDIPPGEPVELPEEEVASLIARFGELPQPKTTMPVEAQPPAASVDKKVGGDKT